MNTKLISAYLLLTSPLLFSQDLLITNKLNSSLHQPRLDPSKRIDQTDIEAGNLTLWQIRKAGLLVFSTPFNKADGYGDGPQDLTQLDNRQPGNRPTLQGNKTFLRVNGLDSQACLECHTIISNATVPARLGIGGVGGIVQNAIVKPSNIDVADINNDGIADFDGRLINPPFLFGSGGVELVGLEMTKELQELKQVAIDNPTTTVNLVAKGIAFGSIIADSNGQVDTSAVVGVNDDLVIKPFGRKGEFATVRGFDVDAMAFHFGMQATELVGFDIDKDGDGVVNEMMQGDLSALSIFNTTMNRPLESVPDENENQGFELFQSIGCSDCHTPQQNTTTKFLPYKLTGEANKPFEDSFYRTDLSLSPAAFKANNQGGIEVRLFSDLKHHYMGEDLKETFSLATEKQNGEYITARLWGIADTAPYLHDGRALTLEDAIVQHDNPGSEAALASQNFKSLDENQKLNIIRFLNTLRTPPRPNLDVMPRIEISLPN